jgi:sodium-dependent dicarboxylate transporter 2/3/5
VLTFPLVAATLIVLWYLLYRLYPTKAVFNVQIEQVTNLSAKRYWVYLIFGITALLWMSEAWHGVPSSLIALIPIVVLTATGIIDRDDIRGLSWEVLWLVAGGIALGISLRDTGLAEWIVQQVPLAQFGSFGVVCVVVVVAGMLSNFLSNTVTASLLIPITISMATGGVLADAPSLQVLALTVACASGIGITLPISTPPNAIAIASGLVSAREMMKVGFLMGILQAVFLLVVARFYWPLIFGGF